MRVAKRSCAAHEITRVACIAERRVCVLARMALLRSIFDSVEGLECIYETKRVKPGLRAGAVENLHRRLDGLERRVNERDMACSRHELEHRVGDDAVGTITSESAAYDIIALLAKELPKLIQAPRGPQVTPLQSSEPSSKRPRLDVDDIETPGTFQFDDTPQLPEPRLLEAIVTAYFHHIHPWVPMIHQTRFLRRFADHAEKKQLLVILHAITIAASKFVPGGWAPTREHQRIRSWVLCTAMDCLSLENLQALIILAFHDIGSGNAAKAWSIVGSLTRTVEYTQLAQEQEDGEHRPFCQPYASLQHTDDWTEIEERRRVFWNVFLLDRFCSVTKGWNTSLTSDDVCRRLPCDGHLWRKQQLVLTPYFGIWDKSKGRIGNPIGYASRFPSPSQAGNDAQIQNQINSTPSEGPSTSIMTDMSTVGAFAYNIEATESMSRVMSYFLQQKINVSDQSEISSWLTRFKELDLRLVHWKMLLPQRWKTNPNLTRHVPLMDPNLTTAHVTHNASMILLHQLIAYPPLHWGFRHRLPSNCSAETCLSSGIEIATITEKYLAKSPTGSLISSQYAFCLFIAARVLLTHWRYTPGNQLPPEFWSLMQNLNESSRRWIAISKTPHGEQDLFTRYSARLKELYELCVTDETYQINVMDYTGETDHYHDITGLAEPFKSWSEINQNLPQGVTEMDMLPTPSDTADFNNISQIMLDQNFMKMDRVITFDDGSMFTAAFDLAADAW
jgi:hypothetical protein